MVNAMVEALTDKTKDQYKVIEERYNILKRYLKEFFEHHYQMTAADVDLILRAIEPSVIVEFENNEDTEEDEDLELNE